MRQARPQAGARAGQQRAVTGRQALKLLQGFGAVTRWRVVRDLRGLMVFAVLRGGCGWRGPGCGGC